MPKNFYINIIINHDASLKNKVAYMRDSTVVRAFALYVADPVSTSRLPAVIPKHRSRKHPCVPPSAPQKNNNKIKKTHINSNKNMKRCSLSLAI